MYKRQVYSDVIGDFKSQFSDVLYTISFHSAQECLDKIVELEKSPVCIDKIKKEYIGIFSDYYSTDKYLELLSREFLTKN